MAERPNESTKTPVRNRRKRRSKLQVFKETYLPVLIGTLAVILVIVFVTNSVSRSNAKKKAEKEASLKASESLAEQARLEAEEAEYILQQAEYLAAGYDFEAAVAVIDTFSGNFADFPELADKRIEYKNTMENMVAWKDPAQVPNLSFHLLIADPERAFADADYGNAYRNNFITVTEFSNILQQLYDNGYVLVSLHDLVSVTIAANGSTIYEAKTLYLPSDKKPLILTETGVNYYTYMVDGNGDHWADKDGAGFACRLVLDASGNFVNEMVATDGSTVSGAYDMVPILEAFIAEHPDFSLRGARAILGLTGYDGLFGYRTNPSAEDKQGQDAYIQARKDAAEMATALRETGYSIACYTYDNISYGENSVTQIRSDQKRWAEEVTPILGLVDILVFAQNSDIGDRDPYDSDKFQLLQNLGYRYYIGSNTNGEIWASIEDGYFRQSRIMVTGSALVNNPDLFAAFFDAAAVLDPARNS